MEEKTLRTIIVCATLVLLTVLAFGYRGCVVMPKEMAERGFCYQTVLVPAVPGYNGTTYSGYAPCKGKDATPVEATQ